MSKKNHDYRLTRSGRAEMVDGPELIRTERRECPFCFTRSVHNVYRGSLRGRKTAYKVCQACLGKWGGEFIDETPNTKGVKGEIVSNQIWGWVANNHQRIFAEMPERLHLKKGVMGHKRRHKSKPVFDRDLHPELLRILDEPETIRMLARSLEKLQSGDERLYSFIYLKSKGATYRQMSGLLGIQLAVKRPRKRARSQGWSRTGSAKTLNRRAIDFIVSSLPDNITKFWAIDNLSKRTKRNMDSRARVDCPSCACESVRGCSLCEGRGTVAKWFLERYQAKMAQGTWED